MKNPAESLTLLHNLLSSAELDTATKKRIQAVLTETTEETLQTVEQQIGSRKKAMEQRALAAKREEEKQAQTQRRCSHIKVHPITQVTESFLGGQSMQNGYLVLMCQNSACQKVYSNPPFPEMGWEAIPPDLMPKRGIGGVIDMRASYEAQQKILAGAGGQVEGKKNVRNNSR